MQQITVLWTGFPGAPGYSRFYWAEATAPNLAAFTTFFTGIADRLPTNTTVQVQNTGNVISELTGDLIGAWSGPAQAAIVGTSGGAYAAPAGAHINWRTGDVINGRRVRGRTFLVPLSGAAYDSDGTIAATALTDLRTNLATLVTALVGSDFGIWHRPVGGANGSLHDLVSADIPDKTATLRSRRD